MKSTAEAVIIGGGIVGSSIAYHLTELGCSDVLIIEREQQQGLGSTGKSAGGVRAQFATPINVQMSLYSISFFAEFQERVGDTSGYRAHGYLFIATSDAHLKYLSANRERQAALGLDNVELIDREEILKIVPGIYAEDIVGGSFCPTDGFVDPYSVMRGFTARAKERGVRVWTGVEATGIVTSNGVVVGVETSRGSVATPAVVNAAGPWAARVALMAGVEIPVSPLRRQIINTEEIGNLPRTLPMVIDMSNGFHFRREGAGVMMCWPDPDETPGYKMDFDDSFIEKVLTRAASRLPSLAEAPVNPRRCWAGLYEVTPDHHAIIGPVPGIPGLYLANGFSGHGVMHSPATGLIIAEMIISGRSTTLDASALGLDRFATGQLLKETAVL